MSQNLQTITFGCGSYLSLVHMAGACGANLLIGGGLDMA